MNGLTKFTVATVEVYRFLSNGLTRYDSELNGAEKQLKFLVDLLVFKNNLLTKKRFLRITENTLVEIVRRFGMHFKVASKFFF